MVDEEKTPEEEHAAEDSGEGSIAETTDLIKQQRERIEELETEKKDREVADAKKQMAGRAEAGSVPEKPKEETDKEYKDRIMRGE